MNPDEAPPEGGKDAFTREKMQLIASLINEELPDKWGFFLMTFPFNDAPGRMNYVANGDRKDIINLMKEFIKKSEGQPNIFKHLPKPEVDPLSETAKDMGVVQPYSDLDLMPFGKHVNVRLQDVPASYLHWLWGTRPLSDARLEAYIATNLKALKQEYPNGIW